MTVLRVGKESGNFSPTQRSEDVAIFLNSIRGFDVISAEEELELFSTMKNSTNEAEAEAARKKLIESHQKFVFSVAKKYANAQMPVLDLVDEGNIGLMEAVDKFDATKGTRFLTFAVWYIRRNIGFYIVNHSQAVRSANKQKLINIVPKAKAKFIQENGREPSNEELVEIIEEMSNIKIANKDDVADMNFSSINDIMSGDDNKPTPAQLEFDSATASYNNYEAQMDAEETNATLDTLLSICTDKERTLLKMLYGVGYDYPMSPEDVAMELGMTPARVVQVKKNLLVKLRKYATVTR
jgi:RNA polymerase primary sigma factor